MILITLDLSYYQGSADDDGANQARDAGIDVQIDRGQGSGGVPVALAGGSYDMGYADLNPAIKQVAASEKDRAVKGKAAK